MKELHKRNKKMTTKTTLQNLMDSIEVLNKLNAHEFRAKTAYKIQKNIKNLHNC